jgi:hypothetical protein
VKPPFSELFSPEKPSQTLQRTVRPNIENLPIGGDGNPLSSIINEHRIIYQLAPDKSMYFPCCPLLPGAQPVSGEARRFTAAAVKEGHRVMRRRLSARFAARHIDLPIEK